jgi:ABC-2 type transport system ATP-binding protein
VKALEVVGLTKRYRGTAALDAVSFDVDPGDAVALVGPNGAGKTTLLRILATLLKPDAGHAKVMGYDGRFQGPRVRSALGYMPDQAGMEDDLTVGEYLDFFAGLHGIAGEARSACVKGLVDLLDLGEVREKTCGALSRGMQQRVALGRTLVHNPSVLLLDEPAANLDPRARIEIREVLKELRRMGKTILVSSHILLELGEFCSKLLLMDRGKVVHYGPIGELAGALAGRRRVAVRAAAEPEELRELLAAEPAVEEAKADGDGWVRLRLREGQADYSFVVRRLAAEGLTLLGLQEEEPSLEEVFLRLTSKRGGA